MNTKIDARHAEVIKTGQLKRTGEDYALVLLSSQNIPQILALEEIAFADLEPAEQNYLLKKDRSFFEEHFTGGGEVLGIIHKGRLIAQSVIVNPTAEHPKTGMVDLHLKAPLEKTSVLQGVIVDPAYRGNHLMAAMIDAWMEESDKHGRTDIISEVTLANAFSWHPFMQKGLHIESIGIDPADGTEVYNLHAHLPSLRKAFNRAAKKPVTCAPDDIAQQKKLFAKGYKATGFDAANDTLEFRRAKKKTAFCP